MYIYKNKSPENDQCLFRALFYKEHFVYKSIGVVIHKTEKTFLHYMYWYILSIFQKVQNWVPLFLFLHLSFQTHCYSLDFLHQNCNEKMKNEPAD